VNHSYALDSDYESQHSLGLGLAASPSHSIGLDSDSESQHRAGFRYGLESGSDPCTSLRAPRNAHMCIHHPHTLTMPTWCPMWVPI
jgi:hypothetical protein